LIIPDGAVKSDPRLLYEKPGAAFQGAGAGCTGSFLQFGKEQSARQQNPQNEKRISIVVH